MKAWKAKRTWAQDHTAYTVGLIFKPDHRLSACGLLTTGWYWSLWSLWNISSFIQQRLSLDFAGNLHHKMTWNRPKTKRQRDWEISASVVETLPWVYDTRKVLVFQDPHTPHKGLHLWVLKEVRTVPWAGLREWAEAVLHCSHLKNQQNNRTWPWKYSLVHYTRTANTNKNNPKSYPSSHQRM